MEVLTLKPRLSRNLARALSWYGSNFTACRMNTWAFVGLHVMLVNQEKGNGEKLVFCLSGSAWLG